MGKRKKSSTRVSEDIDLDEEEEQFMEEDGDPQQSSSDKSLYEV